jgi:hypothetical protein
LAGKLFTIFILSFVLLGCAPNVLNDKSTTQPSVQPSVPQTVQPSVLPPGINLDVPFFPQAPDGSWKQPWQDSCEEAASLLAYYYATGQTPTKEEFKKDILYLVDWQNENFGSYKDTDAAQTAEMLNKVFNFSSFQILTDPSVEVMKWELSQGHPIIAPFAGRKLHNPFYSNEGPYYHMMVIKGYDEKNFITNDVGTRRGKDYKYPYEIIMSAMHEWNASDINLGAKKVIVVY